METGAGLLQLTSADALACGTKKLLVVARHGHTQHNDTSEVEEDDTHQGLADSPGDVLPGVGGLSKRNTDQLGAEVGECSLNHGSPEAEEASRITRDAVVLRKGTRVLPVVEARPGTFGVAAEGNDQTQQDEHDDDERFDQRHPELCLAEELDMDELFGHWFGRLAFACSLASRGRSRDGEALGLHSTR